MTKLGKCLESWLTALGFLSLSVIIFGQNVIFNPAASYVGRGSDPQQYIWSLAWWPHALSRGENPFLVPVVWAPLNYNLTWFTSVPGPSLALWPVTKLWGPVVAYNVWFLLAPALAAWICFVLCRRVTHSFWPAVLAGYLFGFSSYMIGHMSGHLDLITTFPIPLAILLVLLRLDKTINAPAYFFALTLNFIFLFLASPELFATTSFFGTISVCLSIAMLRGQRRADLCSLLKPSLASLVAAAALLSPFFYYMFIAGEPRMPLESPVEFSTDLLNFLVPTSTWLGSAWLGRFTAEFHGNYSENTGYLGIPLILIVYIWVRRHRREPLSKILSSLLALICIASLGARLHVGGAATIPLPWMLIQRLPLIDQALPARFMVFAFVVVAIIAALYMSDDRFKRSTRVVSALGVILFTWPTNGLTSKADTPIFFRSGHYRHYLARGDIALVLPFGSRGNSLLWQAQTDMYFRMPAAYVEPPPAEARCWPRVENLRTARTLAEFNEELKLFFVAHRINAIIKAPGATESWLPVLPSIAESVLVDDVTLYRVQGEHGSDYKYWNPSDPTLLRLQGDLNLRRYGKLLTAAAAYESNQWPPDQLTPSAVEARDLLVDDDKPIARSPPSNVKWQGDLWLGSWGPGEVGVGVTGCSDTLRAIIENFGLLATRTFFPYPARYHARGESHRSGQLVMVFNRAGLATAATVARSLALRDTTLRVDTLPPPTAIARPRRGPG